MTEVIETADGDVFTRERKVDWNQCEAYAVHVSDDGKERVVICSLGRHAPPGDQTELHYDPDLEIWWRWAGEWLSE